MGQDFYHSSWLGDAVEESHLTDVLFSFIVKWKIAKLSLDGQWVKRIDIRKYIKLKYSKKTIKQSRESKTNQCLLRKLLKTKLPVFILRQFALVHSPLR